MKLILASSSTGGHIYPALAIAGEVRAREPDAKILFISSSWEIGKDIVGRYGYEQVFIDVEGFDRRRPWRNISTLKSLVRSSGQIKKIFKDFKPDAVIGTGGHIAGPVVRAARKQGIPTMIQEQNVLPGLANRLAERYADRIFIAFPESAEHFKEKDKLVVTGNPVRPEVFQGNKTEARTKFGIPESDMVVLIFGGSQGATRINEVAVETMKKLGRENNYCLILITGPQLYDETKRFMTDLNVSESNNARILDYIESIAEYYAAADLIVSRAGALSISEIAAAGRAAILIPSPNVVNNHQYYNAKAMADLGAAVILNENEVIDGGLARKIEELFSEPDKLDEMGDVARGFIRPDAAKVIVDELYGTRIL